MKFSRAVGCRRDGRGVPGAGLQARARDRGKGPRTEVASNADRLARFEGKHGPWRRLHPNILALHDVGESGGIRYVVTELLKGKTLRGVLAHGPLPPGKALDVALQVAEGLAAAHENGIVHRDIKPENVFVTKEGHVKILDFGIARLLPSLEASGVNTETSTEIATQPGTTLGTVAYMSPEQACGQLVDFRSDQFSLGVVLYEMLTGRRPFAGTSTAEVLAAIVRDEPQPVTSLDPRLPPLLGWVVQRCLSKDPEERYSSTRDLAKELQSLQAHLSEAAGATDTGIVRAPSPAAESLQGRS